MSDTIRPFVVSAVHQAMNANELDPFNFYEALHAAERMYCVNWKQFRTQKGMWTCADEERAAKYAVPNGTARRLLDTDPEILRILVSRDDRLPVFRDMLGKILASNSERGMHAVIGAFIEFAYSISSDTRPWRVTIHDVGYVFPGKDAYAMWVCLQDML